MLLVPGAWMGGWIWDDQVQRLHRAGLDAHTLTLSGLAEDTATDGLAGIGLDDHVADTLRVVRELDGPVVIVGHSYSGLVAGMVADRAPDQVVHAVIVAGFLPRDGRSLLDDWGDDAEARAAERADIEEAGMVWHPPPAEGVSADPGLSPAQARWLGERLSPHPGRTVLDPVRLDRPLAERSVTVVANVGEGDPRSTLPADLADEPLDRWRFRSVPAGHWPMVGCPDALHTTLTELIQTPAG